jgi:hypothetical protein
VLLLYSSRREWRVVKMWEERDEDVTCVILVGHITVDKVPGMGHSITGSTKMESRNFI